MPCKVDMYVLLDQRDRPGCVTGTDVAHNVPFAAPLAALRTARWRWVWTDRCAALRQDRYGQSHGAQRTPCAGTEAPLVV